jgi:apolipoprotein N-acyltransferase
MTILHLSFHNFQQLQNFFISCNKILKFYENLQENSINAKSIWVQWCFKFVHHSFLFIWCYNQHWVNTKVQG